MAVCLSFCAGAAVAGALAARLTAGPALAGAILAVIAVVALDRRLHAGLWPLAGDAGAALRVCVALALLAGALLALLTWRTRGLPAAADGERVRLTGAVTAVEPGGAIAIRAPVATSAGARERTLQTYPRRGWPAVVPGDRVTVSGSLVLPRPPGNPGGFDYAVYARAAGLAGTVDADSLAVIRPAPAWRRLAALPARAGQRAATVLDRLFPEPDASLLYGLIFGGDSDQLPAQMASDFRRAGLLHLLAASGSNVAFILGAAIWALRRLLPGRPALLIGLGIVVVYWQMTGGGASIGRAALMAVIVIAAQLVRRRSDSLTSLAVAAAALTVVNPLTSLDAGFELSFGATWGLLRLSPPIREWLRGRRLPDWLAGPLAVTLGAQAGVLPVSMNLFGEQSLISPLTNLAALPLAGGAVVTGSLCCLLGAVWLPLAMPAAAVTAVLLRLLTGAVSLGARAPFASIALPAMPLCWAAAYYAWARLATARRVSTGPVKSGEAGRAMGGGRSVLTRAMPLALALTVLLMAARPARSGPGSGLRITFIDVRQGDSALVELPNGRRVLVDCGDMAGPSMPASDPAAFAGPGGKYDAAGRAIVPFLRRANIRSLDAIIITHDHTDHNGGLPGIRRAVRVGQVLTGRDLVGGQSFAPGGATMTVLWPGAGAPQSGNNASVVLRLDYAGHSALLTGDIEDAVESDLVRDDALAPADVLKVAHHGGAGSTGAAFLAAVRPAIGVISVGAGNTFGHPSIEALARLAEAGVQVLRTDRLGAVRVAFDRHGMRVWHWDGRAWRLVPLTGTRVDAAKHSSHGLYLSQ